MKKHNTLHLCTLGLAATLTSCTELTQLGISGEVSPIRGGESGVSAARHATKLSLGPDVFMPGYGDPKVGDIDGDGLDDLIVSLASTQEGPPGALQGMTSYLFYGRGVFPEQLSLDDADATFASGVRESVAVGDVNGDKLSDFVLGDETGVEFVFGTATRWSGHYPKFTAGQKWSYSGPPPEGGVLPLGLGRTYGLGDVNGDGADDFILEASVPDANSLNKLGYRQFVIEGRKGAWPTGTWEPSWASAVYSPHYNPDGSPILLYQLGGDVNGDGYADLLGYSEDDRTWLFYGGPAGVHGTLTAARADAELPRPPSVNEAAKTIEGGYGRVAVIKDIDGDGADDFLLARVMGETQIVYGSSTRFSGVANLVPDLTFSEHDAYPVSGDFNADGLPDLIVSAAPLSSLQVTPEMPWLDPEAPSPYTTYELRGTGTRLTGSKVFDPGERYQPVGYTAPEGINSNFGVIGDIDGDGSTDLVGAVAEEPTSETEWPKVTLYLLPGSQKSPD
jgi:hypothetical protein